MVRGEINPPRPPQLPPSSDRSTDLANVNFNSILLFPCCGCRCPGDESPVKATHCPQQTKRSIPESGAFTLLQEPVSSCGLWRMLLPQRSSLPKSAANTNVRETGVGDNFQKRQDKESVNSETQGKLPLRHLKARKIPASMLAITCHNYYVSTKALG